jgi:catechol 2,3-dioxygenase-like lactoylglutathione lyase family enzyme
MLRIQDPQASVDFYTRVLGMSLLMVLPFESMAFTLYFLGYEEAANIPQDPRERVRGSEGSGLGWHHSTAQRKVLALNPAPQRSLAAATATAHLPHYPPGQVGVWPPRAAGAHAQLGHRV